jgi:hypothetical protein
MKDLFLRLVAIARRVPAEVWLLLGIFALMTWRFGGAWSGEPMPQGDWPGHEQAALAMAQCLQGGHWDCFVSGQLGGMPLFELYAPLFFVVTAGLWLMTAKLVPIYFIMRALVFLGVFAVAPALWYFARAYLDERAARWALALSPLYIFYPSAHGLFGLGAAGAFMVGLVPAAFGVPLALVLAGALKNATEAPGRGRAWWVATLAATALALTHTMSLLFGALVSGLLFAWVAASGKLSAAWRLLGIAAAAFGLVAFWLVPLAAYSGISPGRPIVDVAIAWWSAVFPANIVMGKPLAVIVAGTSLGGLYLCVRRRHYALLTVMLGAWTFFLCRHAVHAAFPSAVIHYYRFGAFLHLFGLAASGLALSELSSWAAARQARGRLYVVACTVIVVLMGVFLFDAKFQDEQDGKRVLDSRIVWSIEDLPGATLASDVVSSLSDERGVGRVFVESSEILGAAMFGSHYYLPARLANELHLATSTGLYVLNSTLTPFYYAASSELTAGPESLRAGETIRAIRAYRQQPVSAFLGRLADLGVTHQVFITPEKVGEVRAAAVEEEIVATPEFSAFRSRTARPLVSAAHHDPIIFASAYGDVTFRELAMALYAGERTYDALVIEEPRPVERWSPDLLKDCGGIIVDAGRLDERQLDQWRALGVPVLALNSEAGATPKLAVIKAFEPMTSQTILGERAWPDGWETLWQEVEGMVAQARRPASVVELVKDDGRRLAFKTHGAGPVVVNYSYFPSWQVTDGADRLYRVTPDRMMVMADGAGEVTLAYGGTTLQAISLGATLGTVMILAWLLWHDRRR